MVQQSAGSKGKVGGGKKREKEKEKKKEMPRPAKQAAKVPLLHACDPKLVPLNDPAERALCVRRQQMTQRKERCKYGGKQGKG